MKAEMKCIIVAVMPATARGENNFMVQEVIVRVPGYTDQFGDKKSEDEIWKLEVLGEDKIKAINLDEKAEGAKGTAAVYINSKMVRNKENTAELYFVSCVLAGWTYYPVGSNGGSK